MNRIRIERMFYDHEDEFIGMDMYAIDSLLDRCWLYDKYDNTYINGHFTLLVIDDDYTYAWQFDEDDICIACECYETEEDKDAWGETLEEIEEREYRRAIGW